MMYWGNGGIADNFGTRWRWVVTFISLPLFFLWERVPGTHRVGTDLTVILCREFRLLCRLACDLVAMPTELNSAHYCFFFIVSSYVPEHVGICLLLTHCFPAVAPPYGDQPYRISSCVSLCSALIVISNHYENDESRYLTYFVCGFLSWNYALYNILAFLLCSVNTRRSNRMCLFRTLC
jgi:hypothetical protein